MKHLFFSVFILFQAPVQAFDWRLEPSLSIEQIYTDNVRLTENDKKSALITEVSPKISLKSTSSISKFTLDYQLQALYNQGGDSGLDLNNRLQMNTEYEFVKNKLFLDSRSSISQQNTSIRGRSGDNISGGSGDTTTVSTFHLSPYWRPHFSKYADGEFRVGYDRVNSEGGNSQLSETNTLSQNFRLSSGRYFSYVTWSLNFNNRYSSNSDGENVSFQNSTADIRYAIGREFSVFGRVGQSSNSFESNTNSNNNGFFYTVGGRWQPSHRFSVEAGYGNNSFVTVDIAPFSRLHWITTYRNNDIGLNSGSTWETELNYRTKRSVWSITYEEQTQTTQQLLNELRIFTATVPVVNPTTGAVTFEDRRFLGLLPTLTDEVFTSKRGEIRYSFRTGKSDISADASRTIRSFEVNQNEQTITQLSANWSWRYSDQTSTLLRAEWRETESKGTTSFSDERFDVSFAVTRNILDRLNGRVEYRYIDQTSDDNLNSFSENRITASLSYRY